MKTRLVGLLGTLALAALGCRTDPNTVLLERELRRQEDQIYRLEDQIDQQCALIERYKKENATLGKGSDPESKEAALPLGPGPAITPRSSNGSKPPEGLKGPPLIEFGTATDQVPDSLKSSRGAAPKATAPDSLAPSFPPADSLAPPAAGKSERPMLADPMQPVRATASNVNVARITLVPVHTGGYDVDGKPGDDGITVMIVPRGPASEVLDAPAAVEVSLLDEELRGQGGDAARVALWEFPAAKIAQRFRRTPANKGIYLELLWPDKPPKHKRLHVYVRYETTDGRKLQADQAVEITLPDDQSWTTPAGKRSPLRASVAPKASPQESGEIILAPPQISGPAERPAPAGGKPQALRPTWSPYR